MAAGTRTWARQAVLRGSWRVLTGLVEHWLPPGVQLPAFVLGSQAKSLGFPSPTSGFSLFSGLGPPARWAAGQLLSVLVKADTDQVVQTRPQNAGLGQLGPHSLPSAPADHAQAGCCLYPAQLRDKVVASERPIRKTQERGLVAAGVRRKRSRSRPLQHRTDGSC